MKVLRCVVYTRKSTEDGLEQEFNSLDAQREACEAYILSQRHEGWTLLPNRYDDGGFSGGNMERPGLKALLAEVDAGQVDVIVVYKVDRLTRSLADFAKIVERLDARLASFVSVTQAFNTTTSMGRLTLNVLLSFAQFEREVTGERIRDKIAASKKKGMWMGGPVPLGYQVIERKLVPVPEEAERVRMIMRRYLEVRSVPAMIEVLHAEGVVTKIQQRSSGPHRGGIPFARGSLFHLLKNPVYRGKIVHKGKVYDGEHEAIIGEDLWQRVQMQLAEKAPPRRHPTNDPPSTRFAQGALDQHLLEHLSCLLNDEHALRRLAQLEGAEQLRDLFEGARLLRARLDNRSEDGSAVRSLVAIVKVRRDILELTLKPKALGLEAQPCWLWKIPLPERKPFREAKLRIDALGQTVDPHLVRLLAEALEVQSLVAASPELSLNQLAKQVGRCRKQMAKLLSVSWLSPRIIEAIANGTQPAGLSRSRLLEADLPIDWAEQEELLGFAG